MPCTKPMVVRKKKPLGRPPKPKINKYDCVIPPALPAEVLGEFVLNSGSQGRRGSVPMSSGRHLTKP